MPYKFPNQKLIKVIKEDYNEKAIYARINKNAMYEAMRTFSGRKAPTFELWCYIASNANGYEFALSQKAVEEAIGMKADAYNAAVNNLIAEGYLINENPEKKTVYLFYEKAKK